MYYDSAKRKERTLQAVAVEVGELDAGLSYLVDRGGLEQPQPRAGGVVRDQVKCMAQLRLGGAYIFGGRPGPCFGGCRCGGSGSGGGACDGDGLVCNGFKVTLGTG